MPAARVTLMIRLSKLVISCGLVFAGCGTSEDSVTANTNEQSSLSGPYITQAGTSSANVVSSLGGESGLVIDGGSELGSFASASYGGTGGSPETTVEFTVTRASGASFVYSLIGSGTRYSTRSLRLQLIPGSTDLQAAASSGLVACGAIAPDAPTAVAVVFNTGAQTFDVVINGAASACTGLRTNVVPPLTGFNMMDASNEGFGGRVEFGGMAMY
jgi:hypothetical protein